ncbi:Partitioning defective 3, partial [Schistosoma japonicum]
LEEVDAELQLDQPPILRNRKQNTSFRHAVDRSLFPTTTDSPDIIPFSSSPPPPPPIPPHRPRSESNSRDKSNNSRYNKSSSKTKHSNPLLQQSSNSVLSSSSSPSVNKTPNKHERPRSKTRTEVHSNDSPLVEVTLSSCPISNNSNNNSQVPTAQNKQNKSSLTSLKNLFRIGTSKTLSESNEHSLIKNADPSSKTSESITLLSKKQLRRLSVPDHNISSHLSMPPKLMNEDNKRNIYTNPTVPSVNQTPNHHPISGQFKLSSATHIYPQTICNDALYNTKSSNTIIANPYCPPPDVNPPPLPPRVSYSTPPVLTPKSCHSKTIKYRPLPEPSDNVDKTKHTNRRKKSSHSNSISANHKPSLPAYNQSPKVISTNSSFVCSPSSHPPPLPLYTAEPTMVLSNVKKSNSCYNNRNESLNDNTSLVSKDSPNCHHFHQQQRQHKSSECSMESQTPAVYMNSQNISRESKKNTPSPHRSRSSHSRLSSNKSQHTNYHNHNNNNAITNKTASTTMVVTTTTSESILYYQAPLLSSHSTMSTPRRHRLQDGRKSEYYLNNRILQVTMQEASLIASQPIDKLITSKRTSHNHHQ